MAALSEDVVAAANLVIVATLDAVARGVRGADAALRELRAGMPNRVMEIGRAELPRILSTLFPLHGVVRRLPTDGGGYYYFLALDGDFTGVATRSLALTEPPRPAGGVLEPPPSTAGSHVTLSSSTPAAQLGKAYAFHLTASPFDTWKVPAKPSGFDPSLAITQWYALNVTGLPSAIVDTKYPPHISLAVQGIRKK